MTFGRLDAWKEAHWNAPTLEDRLTTEEVRLTLPIPFETNANVTDNAPDNAENVPETLTETAESLASKLSVSQKTVQRDLKHMKELGIIKREGGDFGGRWVVCQ